MNRANLETLVGRGVSAYMLKQRSAAQNPSPARLLFFVWGNSAAKKTAPASGEDAGAATRHM
jgi:hypothetical protein